MKSVLFYLRSFLLARYENQLEIYINYDDRICKRIYPFDDQKTIHDDDDFGIQAFLSKELQAASENMNDSSSKVNPLNLSFALSMILCQNNCRKLQFLHKSSSILIVNESDSIPNSQYVQFMNGIFEAQRNGIKINVLDFQLPLDNNCGSVLLKQASCITSGFYVVLYSISEVIPALFQFSNESKMDILCQPKQKIVDFRGSCFCHGKIVDVGFVCSVCLSGMFLIFYFCFVYFTFQFIYFLVFCSFGPFCKVCKTKFNFPTQISK